MTQPTPQTEAGRRLVAAYHVDRLMVIAIENEAQARTEALDVKAAVHTMQRAGLSQVWALSLAPLVLAAALTGERHDLDDEYLTPEQRERVAILAAKADR